LLALSTFFDLKTMSVVIAAAEQPVHERGAERRGMWIWKTRSVITDRAALEEALALLGATHVTDVYLYLRAADYVAMEADLRYALGALHNAGIRTWGLEGYRGYFSDMYGAAELYEAADSLVQYNGRVGRAQRFAGFMSDLEPQDGADPEAPRHFHNGIPDSRLTGPQAVARDALMQDWIAMHETLSRKMRAARLKYAATMVSWADDYHGEEIRASYKGVTQGVMKHIMPLVDDYVVMSYNTDPRNAAHRVEGEAVYADELAGIQRVFAAVETHRGVGATISYGDTRGKDSPIAVLKDIEAIENLLRSHDSFAGVAIHDWSGWKQLEDSRRAFGLAD
jgi:hypothetical protein